MPRLSAAGEAPHIRHRCEMRMGSSFCIFYAPGIVHHRENSAFTRCGPIRAIKLKLSLMQDRLQPIDFRSPIAARFSDLLFAC